MEDYMGYIAGTLTTIAFLPQAYKVVSTKNVDGISFGMYIIFTTGVFCWLVYGIMLENLPMTIFNVITLALAFVILYNLFRYRKKQ